MSQIPRCCGTFWHYNLYFFRVLTLNLLKKYHGYCHHKFSHLPLHWCLIFLLFKEDMSQIPKYCMIFWPYISLYFCNFWHYILVKKDPSYCHDRFVYLALHWWVIFLAFRKIIRFVGFSWFGELVFDLFFTKFKVRMTCWNFIKFYRISRSLSCSFAWHKYDIWQWILYK